MPKGGLGDNSFGRCRQPALEQAATTTAAVAGAPPPSGRGNGVHACGSLLVMAVDQDMVN